MAEHSNSSPLKCIGDKSVHEVLKIKKYKTMEGFIRGCRSVMKDVLGSDDDLTMVVGHLDEPHLRKEHYGKTFLEILQETGNLSYNQAEFDREKNKMDYKSGFDFRFDDGIIYVFSEECE